MNCDEPIHRSVSQITNEMEIEMKALILTLYCAALLFGGAVELFGFELYGSESEAAFVTYDQPISGTPVTTFEAKMWGDGFLWEHETDDGYTIVLNQTTGYWCYAVRDGYGYYVPSQYRVEIDAPPTWITTHLRRSNEAIDDLEDEREAIIAGFDDAAEEYDNHINQVHTTRIGVIFFDCTSSNLIGQILDFAKERFDEFDMSFQGIGQSIIR